MRVETFAILLSLFSFALAPASPASADDPEWELGASALATFGPLEHAAIGESDWPLFPGGGVEGGLRLSPYVALGVGVDVFVRDLAGFFEPNTVGDPYAMRDRGRVTTFMPTVRTTLTLPLGRGPLSLTGRYAVGAAIDRRYEPCIWLALPAAAAGCVEPDRVVRWSALAQTLTAGLRLDTGARGYLHLEAGFLLLFYPRAHPEYRPTLWVCPSDRCFPPPPPDPRAESDGFRPGGLVRIAGGVRFGAETP